jgi:protein ATS1
MAARLRVIAAGSNAHGQLANEALDDSHTFQPCLFAIDSGSSHQNYLPGDRVVSMASGANHTILLLERHPEGQKRERELWGCGDGRKGQLGPGHAVGGSECHGSSVFRRIDKDILDAAGVDGEKHGIHAIAASWESTYLIVRPRHETLRNASDIVLSMGNNDYGDLGVGVSPAELRMSRNPRRVALEEVLNTSCQEAPSRFQIIALAAGPHQVVATVRLCFQLGGADVLIGWGASRQGQLGMSAQPQTPAKHHSTSSSPITSSPRLIPANDNADPVASFALGNHHTVLLHRSGRVAGLGSNKKGQLAGLREELEVKDVRCTWNGTYFILGDGDLRHRSTKPAEWEIRAIGSHDKGQLGYDPVAPPSPSGSRVVQFPFNDTTHRLVDIACGSEHVLALFAQVGNDGASGLEDTEVWGWGWNEHGNLGLGHTADAHLPTMIWPRSGEGPADGQVLGIWVGCGTSWIVEAR